MLPAFNRRDVAVTLIAAVTLAAGDSFAKGGGTMTVSEGLGTKEAANKALLRRWYDDMWAEMNFALIPTLAGPIYMRHHARGASDPIPAEEYARIAGASEPGARVIDFNYRLIAEGDYVGSIGRMRFDNGHQWDWVQMFRIEGGKLVETWLPGMGGTDPRTYPRREAAWVGSEVPKQGPETGAKAVLSRWYDEMWSNCAFDLIPEIAGPIYTRHDISGATRPLSAEQYRDALKAADRNWKITDFDYFLIAEGDLVVAIGTWKMGEGRQWDWVQAFRIADGKMVETWLPAMGGTDRGVIHTPSSKWDRSVIPAPFNSPKP
jgi:predicted SnoaL-like aldol condensation-catalyzing enzyme